jgi:hypothetical protein
MELDIQSLFGLHAWLHVHCAQLYSLAETLQLPPPPAFGLIYDYEGAIGQPRLMTSLWDPLILLIYMRLVATRAHDCLPSSMAVRFTAGYLQILHILAANAMQNRQCSADTLLLHLLYFKLKKKRLYKNTNFFMC